MGTGSADGRGLHVVGDIGNVLREVVGSAGQDHLFNRSQARSQVGNLGPSFFHLAESPVDQQYDLLLEEQAYPFEEQAISLHETNVQRVESGLYDAWIGRSQASLATLVPARYAKLERSATYVQALY